MATKLQIAQAKALVDLAEITGTLVPTDIIKMSQLEFVDPNSSARAAGAEISLPLSRQRHSEQVAHIGFGDWSEVMEWSTGGAQEQSTPNDQENAAPERAGNPVLTSPVEVTDNFARRVRMSNRAHR